MYEFVCVRLSVCKDQCSQMCTWKSPGLSSPCLLPRLKEVLKCTEEVARQMTLIDHGVYHMMSCDPHDDHTTSLFSTTMQDLCTGATSEGQYGPQATVPEEFKDVWPEPSVQLIPLVSGAIRDRH